MAVHLPTSPISIPSALAGQSNGRLSPAILRSTPGQAGGTDVILLAVAARAWRALCAEAAASGHVLKITGSASAYRTYSWQYKMFTERYVTYNTGSGVSVIWNGRRWWKRKGAAVTAKPGTSNHGWGLAVDTGEERDGDSGTEPLDDPTLRWLIGNEHRFGFSHELQSERWHIRYVAGDRIPPAVLAYETNNPPTTNKDWFDMATEADLRRIVKEEIDAHERWLQIELGTNDGGPRGDSLYGRIRANADTIQDSLARLVRQLAEALGHPLP